MHGLGFPLGPRRHPNLTCGRTMVAIPVWSISWSRICSGSPRTLTISPIVTKTRPTNTGRFPGFPGRGLLINPSTYSLHIKPSPEVKNSLSTCRRKSAPPSWAKLRAEAVTPWKASAGDHFSIGVPFGRAINPVTHGDWEGKGVEPDVKVGAADALATAEKLAADKLAGLERPSTGH